MALRLRRGTNAERLTVTPESGEIIYVTDSKKLYVGDGSTVGGNLVSGVNDIIDDATPQLGGDLDLNGNNITGNGNININGTITASGNINLGDGSGDTISVGGEVSGNLIPTADNSFDLGSNSNRWRSAFFSNLQVDGQLDAIAINGDIIADDSTVVFDASANTLRAESLTGTFTGNVIGNVTGNVIGNVTGNAAGNHTGTFQGDITATGTFDGDMTGSVFGNDSSVMLDGNSSEIVGNIRVIAADSTDFKIIYRCFEDTDAGHALLLGRARGTVDAPTALLPGDQTGGVLFTDASKQSTVGSIYGEVDPDGTPTPTVSPGKISFRVANSVGSPVERAYISSNGFFNTLGVHVGQSTAPTGIGFYSLNSSSVPGSDGPRLLMRRARGTYDTPTAVVDTDVLHRITFGGHDGTSFSDNAFITARVDGTVSTGVIPTSIDIKTTDSAGSVQTNSTYRTDGATEFNGAVKLANYADSTARDAAIPNPETGMMVFLTGTSKAQVNTDGTTGGWVDLH